MRVPLGSSGGSPNWAPRRAATLPAAEHPRFRWERSSPSAVPQRGSNSCGSRSSTAILRAACVCARPSSVRGPRDLVDELARWCADRDARLLVDEVARGTLLAGAPSMSSLPEFAEGRVVVVGDVSKAYGLGGLRVGWLTSADRDLIRRAATTK